MVPREAFKNTFAMRERAHLRGAGACTARFASTLANIASMSLISRSHLLPLPLWNNVISDAFRTTPLATCVVRQTEMGRFAGCKVKGCTARFSSTSASIASMSLSLALEGGADMSDAAVDCGADTSSRSPASPT